MEKQVGSLVEKALDEKLFVFSGILLKNDSAKWQIVSKLLMDTNELVLKMVVLLGKYLETQADFPFDVRKLNS